MSVSEQLTTYLELRESQADGAEGSGLSHSGAGLVLVHVLELAALGAPRGGITLVHDAGDHGARYLPSARVLAQNGWAVALPDLRGHGRSEGARGHSAGRLEVLRDLQSIQDHLAYRLPDAPKVLIGQGLGALYALDFALEKPTELAALVLLAPRWRPSFAPPKPAGGLLKLFKKPQPSDPGAIGIKPSELTGSDVDRHAWEGDPLVHDVITRAAAQQVEQLAARCRTQALDLAVPTLLLHGTADVISDPSDSRAFVGPKVTLRIEEGLAHDLLHERGSERIAAQISAWLEGSLPAAG
jgi:alpha-beta hydrolase superfamily lysophospholipase